jgi:hypothetical protein
MAARNVVPRLLFAAAGMFVTAALILAIHAYGLMAAVAAPFFLLTLLLVLTADYAADAESGDELDHLVVLKRSGILIRRAGRVRRGKPRPTLDRGRPLAWDAPDE